MCTAVALGLIVCGPSLAAEQENAFARCARLGRGVNLGSALEAPKGQNWGFDPQPKHLDLIKAAGFDSVRIPIRWSDYAAKTPPYTIEPEWFARVDKIVGQCLARGLAVVINVHHYEELMVDPSGHRERFLALWEQIAGHYRSFGPELYFELLNEPNGKLTPELWNALLRDALDVVRRSNSERTIIVGTALWGGIRGLGELALPEQDRNLIVTVHYYEPFHFTHQGSWAKGADAWLGTTWQGAGKEQRAVLADFDAVSAWANQHKRPVYLGEFGAYGKADLDSRVRWTRFVAEETVRRHWSFAYWEFGAGFGVYDQKAGAWREPLLRALIPKADAPTEKQ